MTLVPRIVHRWRRWSHGLTLGVKAIVTEREQVMLVRHGYVDGWHLPGGGVDRGETILEALERELREETGLTLDRPARLHGLLLNRSLGRDHVAVFIVEHFTRGPVPQPGFEIAAQAFFPVTALPEDTTPATRRRIEEFRMGAPAASCW